MSQVTENKVVAAPVPMTPLQEFWHYFKRNKGAVVGLAYVAVMIIIAVFANFIAPYNPADQFRDALLAPPFWQEGGSVTHLLGTDDVGRDILSRLMYGARLSLLVGCLVVVLSLILGVVLGLLLAILAAWLTRSLCALSILCWPCRACCWRWCWWPSSAHRSSTPRWR
jgi:dipeptide transport system permease protein